VGFLRQNIAIDLGTSTVLVNVENQGIIINTRSVVAIDSKTEKIVAVGDEAFEMEGRTSKEYTTIRPIQNGVISSFSVTKKMISYFLNQAVQNPLKRIFKPDIILSIPTQTTGVEKRAVERAVIEAGADRVFLVEGPLAAAIGAGLDISKPTGKMIVDMGGGTTDIAIISYEGIVTSASTRVAGGAFDDTIKNYLKRKYNLIVGDATAENIKINIGSVYHSAKSGSMDILGTDLITGLPCEKTINSDELMEPLMETAMPILDTLHSVLEKTPPELVADIYGHGITMTGGGCRISGLDELIRKSTGIDVIIAPNPQTCVVEGCMKILSEMSAIRKSELNNINKSAI